MSPHYHLQSIRVVPLLAHIFSEEKPGSSCARAPSLYIRRVTPKQVAHRSSIRHLLHSVYFPNVVQVMDAGTQSSMETKKLLVDSGVEGEEVENVR